MLTIHFGSPLADHRRRELLYEGDLFVIPATSSSLGLVAHARSMLEAAFAPYDPRDAQRHLDVEEWVGRFAPVKPVFIHDPGTAELMAAIIAGTGVDPDDLYFDVPRLRGVTSDGYLTAGVGYAHGPHRDTWYSAPMAQINWWMPIYPCDRDSVMSFFPRYFSTAVANSSTEFDYYRWNASGRRDAAKHIHADTRPQPKPSEPVIDEELRVVCEPGDLLLFSGSQLHATVPNVSGRSRFSLDFRTVSLGDLDAGRALVNVDSHPSGTSLRDFRKLADRSPMPTSTVQRYDDAEDPEGPLVFQPAPAG